MNAITTPTLATTAALAKQAVKRPKSGPVEHRGEKAGELFNALETVDQLCGELLKQNPQEAKEAKLVQNIAREALTYDDKAGLKDHQKIGIFQGALEVISAVQGSITPGTIAAAAKNVLDGSARLYFLEWHDYNPEKRAMLHIMGTAGVDRLASAIDDRPAKTALHTDPLNDESALCAVSQMGDLDLSADKPVNVKLLGKIADKTLEERKGEIFDPERTLSVMSGSLKIIETLAPEVDDKHTIYPHLGFALGQIADRTLQQNRITVPAGHFSRKTKPALTPEQQIGNCQGALTVLSELSEGPSYLSVKHMAGSLLYAEERMYFSKGAPNRRKNDQMYLSGRDALKTYAQGAEIKGTSQLEKLKTPEKVREYLNQKWNGWS